MNRDTRRALSRAFFRALHPAHPPASPSGPFSDQLIERREVAALYSDLHTIVEARVRMIPGEIRDQLLFAERQGPDAVRALIEKAIDAALRELADLAEMEAAS